jgi:hypothetical protein
MIQLASFKHGFVAAAALLIASVCAAPVSAQAKAPKTAAPKAAATDAKAPAKAKHRLPANYNKLVDDAQRDKIYAVQDKYAERKASLKKQLDELAAQEDAEIEGLLTADQKTKLAAMKDEAKSKKAAAAKKPAPKKPANDKAEKTEKKPA